MKYFILSSFASAFLLYGMALAYGATGSTNLTQIRDFLASHSGFALGSGFGPLLLVAFGLLAVGFCFKVSAVPFQAWTPDVYVGAPTSVTAFMSVGTKVAAFVGLARVFFFSFFSLRAEWEPVFWVVAVLTMIGGNLMAATQRDVKRMLAYSSVANAGYMLIAVATHTQAAFQGLLIYLVAYAVMNLGAFGVVLALERRDGQGTTLSDFAGLGRRNPALAALMTLFMFALAGTPATAGFIGKWYVFYAAMRGSHVELAIIGVLASAVGVYYYLRVIWAIYFSEPATAPLLVLADEQEPAPAREPVISAQAGGVALAEPAVATSASTAKRTLPADHTPVHPATWLGLALAGILTLVVGIAPMLLVGWAQAAAQTLIK